QGRQQVAPQLGRHRQAGQCKGQADAEQIALDQHRQRDRHLLQQFATTDALEEGAGRLQEAGQQQVVALVTRRQFPDQRQGQQDQRLAQPALLPQALQQRQLALQLEIRQRLQRYFVFLTPCGGKTHGCTLLSRRY